MHKALARKKIVFTGGHAATTALSLIQEIKKRNLPFEIYWIGSKVAIEGKKIETLESNIFPELDVKTYSIISGRVQRRFTIWTIPSLFKIPISFFHALILLTRIKPKLIFSFGGHAAVPVVIVGWILGIPVVVHEQVATAGRTNQLSAIFAKKVLLSRPTSFPFFPSKKVEILGNPVNLEIAKISPKENPNVKKVVFVTGGSRGSQTLNDALLPILEDLTKRYKIIHQTGDLEFEKFTKKRENLVPQLAESYQVYSRVNPSEMAKIYEECDVIVARAGANTVSEIMIIKRPAILVPIPWSYKNEQYENAIFAKNMGIARILNQETLTSKKLLEEINEVSENWKSIVKGSFEEVSPDKNASAKIVDFLEVFGR